jgi:signal transduction histidine kinase
VAGPPQLPDPSRSTELARLELAWLPADASLDRVFRRACELSVEALDVERVGVWLFVDNGAVLRCANLYERSKAEHASGAVLRVADYPTYFASLHLRKAVPAECAAVEPWTAELAIDYLAPLGITSMLDAGIFVEGKLVGVVCHEQVGTPREWSTEARDFAGSVADLLALKIQAAEVRDLRAAFQTQQKRLASQEKLAAMEELAAGIAHDFKNLLNVFHIYGRLLTERSDLPEDARQQAAEIFAASERGVELARALMEFARPDKAPAAIVDLSEAIADYLPTLRAAVGPKYELRFSGSRSPGRVLIEKAQFTRLLMNLVLNASEAMPQGGPIRIRLAPVTRTGKRRERCRFVLLEVIDKGAGMDEATRERVFEPYFTTKPKGTGLGLAVVRQIMDRAGGTVRVLSDPDRGTTMQMFFPAIRAGEAGKPRSKAPPAS